MTCKLLMALGEVVPMDSQAKNFEWPSFLQRFSRELLADADIRESLPVEAVDSGWLGFEGAADSEIRAVEARLGVTLPESYRSFLLVTDGWLATGPFIKRLWPTSRVDWFRVRHQQWIDIHVQPYLDAGQGFPEIPDEQYLVYGDEQDSVNFRVEYLQTALEISDYGDAAILLLNPEVVSVDGEWEAWLFATWLPGAARFRSFRQLMGESLEELLQLREDGNG